MRKYAFDAIISRSAPDLRKSGYKSREAGARQEQGSGARLVTRQPQTSEAEGERCQVLAPAAYFKEIRK